MSAPLVLLRGHLLTTWLPACPSRQWTESTVRGLDFVVVACLIKNYGNQSQFVLKSESQHKEEL